MRLWIGCFLALASSHPARAEISWVGSTGLRQVNQSFDDGLALRDTSGQDISGTSRRSWQYFASFGAVRSGPSLDWGAELRTQPAGAVNSEWVTAFNNADAGVGVGTAYARPHGNFHGIDGAVTIGRQRTVLLYDDLAQSLFGNPVRWDGFGWSLAWKNLGLNLAEYVLGAANRGVVGSSTYSATDSSNSVAATQSHFAVLYAFQPFVKVRFTDDIFGTFALGYYVWNGTGGNDSNGLFDNQVHGGTPGTVGNVSSLPMDNPRQWHVYGNFDLPYHFRFVGEVIRNKLEMYGSRVMAASPPVNADRTAFALTLRLGEEKKAGDFSFQYSYVNKGIASVVSAYTNEDMPADNISHLLQLQFLPEDALAIALKVQYHREKSKLGGDGQLVSLPYNGRQETQRRIEINAGIRI